MLAADIRGQSKKYLVFPRVLQGTDQRSVAAHRVAADGHPVWVGGKVGVDQFGELREIIHKSVQLEAEVRLSLQAEIQPTSSVTYEYMR